MERDIARVLISRERIARRVAELARQITADHAPPGTSGTAGGELVIVPVLTGAMIFCADLIRQIPVPVKIGLLTVSSYPGDSTVSQGSRLQCERLEHVRGRPVLLVDDILDSGGTIRLVRNILEHAGAASVSTCVLLRKDRPRDQDVPVDYVGFDIPDEFVVGYGLDYNDAYRNLPDVVTLRPGVISGAPG